MLEGKEAQFIGLYLEPALYFWSRTWTWMVYLLQLLFHPAYLKQRHPDGRGLQDLKELSSGTFFGFNNHVKF